METLALRHDPQVARFKEQLEAWYADASREAQKVLLQPLRSRQEERPTHVENQSQPQEPGPS